MHSLEEMEFEPKTFKIWAFNTLVKTEVGQRFGISLAYSVEVMFPKQF